MLAVYTHSAGETSFLVVWSHTKSLNEKLHSFIDAVLVIQTKTTYVQCISIGGVHA